MAGIEELVAAVKAGDGAKVEEMLVAEPGLVAAYGADGGSPLLAALYYGQGEIAETLLAAGAVPNLWEAAALGRETDVAAILDREPGPLDSFSHDGFTPLQMASYFGQPGVVSLYLQLGADIAPASRNPMKVTALHAAAAHHRETPAEEIVSLLLARGADPNAVQEGGFTALHAAAQNGYAGVGRLLLEAGADPSAATAKGMTALDFSREKNHAGVLHLLEEYAAKHK